MYKSLQIEPTNKCNLKCRVCWHTLTPIEKKGVLDFALFKVIIDQFANIEDLNLQGLGEPFLTPDLLKMIAYARDKKIAVWLASNLNTDMDERFARQVVDSGLAKIRISIDAANQRDYARIKKGGDFKKVIANIRLVNKVKKEYASSLPVLAFNTIAMKRNIRDIENILRLAHELDIGEIALIPLVVFDKGIAVQEESLSNNIDLVAKYIGEIHRTAEELGVKLEEGISAMHHPDEMGLKGEAKAKCSRSYYVDYSGNLYPCCNVKYHFGCFGNEGLVGMLKGHRFRFFQENILNRNLDCQSCMRILNKD
jgi:MoaA/NifB/PqqE/SkfB family radical SAM enzyme